MPLYVTLYKLTDQGIKNIKDSPKRLEAASKSLEAVGGKLLGAYYTLGEYDLVVISEFPSEEVGVAQALAIGSLGNVRSSTMRAFTPAQFSEILKKLP